MKIESGPAAVDFGGGQGGAAGASPHAPLAEVPEGRPKIAHLFKGGFAIQNPHQVPQGRPKPIMLSSTTCAFSHLASHPVGPVPSPGVASALARE